MLTLHTKHLRSFEAVFRRGSVAAAAAELRRADSAVSRAIRELEAMLEVALFERTPRGLLPTASGRILAHRVGLAFEALRQARAELLDRHADAPAATRARLRSAPVFSLAIHERRLALLLTFAERRHTGAAARALGVSQPAVSMALRDLEGSVGIPLFDRTPSGIGLTPAGEILLLHVRQGLAQLRIAIAELAALRGRVEGQVTVGALPFARPYLLPAAIGQLHRRHPGVTVRTVEGALPALIAGLRTGDIDFVVGALQAEPDAATLARQGLYQDLLLQEELAVIARADHPLARRRRLTLSDGLRFAWVLPPRGTPSRDALTAAFEHLGTPSPRVAVESVDLSIIRGLLLETDMLSAASRPLFHHELQLGSLVSLPIRLPGTRRVIGILSRTPEHSSPLARLLIEALHAVRLPAD